MIWRCLCQEFLAEDFLCVFWLARGCEWGAWWRWGGEVHRYEKRGEGDGGTDGCGWAVRWGLTGRYKANTGGNVKDARLNGKSRRPLQIQHQDQLLRAGGTPALRNLRLGG